MLFHLSDELADRPALGDHHGLAEEGTAFGAADQEVHVRVGDGAGASDQVAGALAVLVGAIASGLFHVGSDEGVEHPGVRALLVVAREVRQCGGKSHWAIIPRSAVLRGQTDLRGFPSA